LKRKGSGEKAGGVRRVQRRLDPGRLKPIPRLNESCHLAMATAKVEFGTGKATRNSKVERKRTVPNEGPNLKGQASRCPSVKSRGLVSAESCLFSF